MGLLILLRKDSVCAKLLPWGKFGALLLGEEEMYSGEIGASRAADRSVRPTGADGWLPAGPESKLWLGGTAEAVPFHESVQGNPAYSASARTSEILRWESLALRAAPLSQDDNSGTG